MADQKKHQINFVDCYVLTDKRTKPFILSFLNTFLPHRREYTDAYEIPQFADSPAQVLTSAEQLIEYLEQNKNETYAVYWSNAEEAKLRGAMCLFMSDGQVIVGVFCETLYPDTSIERLYLKALMEFCNSTKGLIAYEEPAPKDTEEFLQRAAAMHPQQ